MTIHFHPASEVDIVETTEHIGFTAALKYSVKYVKFTVIKSLSLAGRSNDSDLMTTRPQFRPYLHIGKGNCHCLLPRGALSGAVAVSAVAGGRGRGAGGRRVIDYRARRHNGGPATSWPPPTPQPAEEGPRRTHGVASAASSRPTRTRGRPQQPRGESR